MSDLPFPKDFDSKNWRALARDPQTRPFVEESHSNAIKLRDQALPTRVALVERREQAKELLATIEARIEAFDGDLATFEAGVTALERILAETAGERLL